MPHRAGTYDRFETWARRLPGDRPTALVLGAERGHGLAITRSLGRRGVPVAMLGRSGTPGMRSRFGHPIPIDGLDHDGLVELLCDLGRALPRPGVLFATDDSYVLLAARNRESLSPLLRFPDMSLDTLESLADKRRQYDLAASVGVATPTTIALDDESDLDRAAGRIALPCVVKPAYSHAWLESRGPRPSATFAKLAVAGDREALGRVFRQLGGGERGLIAQEIIEGPVDALYATYAYVPRREGKPTVFVRQKLRDYPTGFGNGTYSTGVDEPDVRRLGESLLARLGYRGLANIEFKRDARDGRLKLIEFNVRAASQLALAVDSGVDLPWLAYRDLADLEAAEGSAPLRPSHASPAFDVRWVDFGQDALAATSLRRRKELELRDWLRDLRRARSFAYRAGDDRRPGFARSWELVRAFAARPGALGRPSGPSPADPT